MRPFGVARPNSTPLYSDTIQVCALTTSAQAFDTPTGAGYVSFGANANFAVGFGFATAVFPTTTSTIGSTANPEINPTSRNVGSTADTTGISVCGSSIGGMLTISWYGRG